MGRNTWIRLRHVDRRWGASTTWCLAALSLLGMGAGGFSISVGHVAAPAGSTAVPAPAGSAATTEPVAASTVWTPTELRAAPLEFVPDSEPGLSDHPGVSTGPYQGPDLHLLVTLGYSNASRLTELLAALSNSGSPQYHQYLTAAQFNAEYAPAPAVYNSLLGYLASFGASNLASYADRTTITFTASPSQVSAIFGATEVTYKDGSLTYYSSTTMPALPSPFAPYVSAVSGLSDFSKFLIHTTVQANPQGLAGAPAVPASPPGSVPGPCKSQTGVFTCTSVQGINYPEPVANYDHGGEAIEGADLQVPYDVTPILKTYGYQKTGEINNTIATLLWSDPVSNGPGTGAYCQLLTSGQAAWDVYAPDVSTYFNYTIPAGQPHSDVFSMALAGYTYSYSSGSRGLSASCDGGDANIENTLDVEMAGSLSPGATVYQVFGGGGGTATVLDTDFASVLSPSTSAFSTVSGTDTSTNVAGLANVSVISNSWAYSGVSSVNPLCIPCYHCPICPPQEPGCLVNDTSWYQDLEQAQARGITVLASSGDSGDSNVCSPAAQAYDNFGTVAVGGTTLVLVPSTLARSPLKIGSDPYTDCSGASQACGSEITWYDRNVGFNGAGTVGGVAPVNFTEPSWQSSSSDANGVIQAHLTGNFDGRGVPDIAAIANDSMMTLTWLGNYYNVTQFVSVGLTFEGEGTSVASPVEAGVVNAIDYALQVQHLPRLGFLNPSAYTWGQEQYKGTLSTPAFFDVTAGANTAFSALTGWDPVTGWGPIDGAHWGTLDKGPYTVTFSESGLPSGTPWSVNLTGTNHSSSTASDTFSEASGVYPFTISNATASFGIYSPTPTKGNVTVNGTYVSVGVVFRVTTLWFNVTFTESGLPADTPWNVTLGGTFEGSTTSSIVFDHVLNGTESYTVWDAIGGHAVYVPTPSSGNVTVAGSPQSVSVVYEFNRSLCGIPRAECISVPGALPAPPAQASARLGADPGNAGVVTARMIEAARPVTV